VGRTLGILWRRAGVFEIQDVIATTEARARSAVAYLGGGIPGAQMGQARAAAVWMLSTPDDGIVNCARTLSEMGVLREPDIVFHCSGALSSADLEPATRCGARVASVHPLKSFADPDTAASSFAGTWCAAEGDAAALAVLEPAFSRIGGRVIRIESKAKPLYHAGSVIASNYLVALLEAALQCYERAGIPRDDALTLMTPLVRETFENVLRRGTAGALTGPIARGDAALVKRQHETLERSAPEVVALYRQLGAVAVRLARETGEADADALAAIEKILTC
jgi:predicted short-subunit dehydrogenase-like oxidoreductase (DUF2520 family)